MGKIAAYHSGGETISTPTPVNATPAPIDIYFVPGMSAPIVSTNVADLANADATSADVFINSQEAVKEDSTVPTSISGTAPSNAVGVASGQAPHLESTMVTGSATVFVNGEPLMRHRDPTLQSAGNCAGVVKLTEGFSLGNGIEVDASLSEADQLAIIDALDLLYERPISRDLLIQLQDPAVNQGNVTTITTTTGGNGANPDNINDAYLVPPAAGSTDPPTPNIGTNVTVNFNLTNTFAGTPLERPPEVGLGHELIHALHSVTGTLVQGTRQDTAHPSTTNIFELQAIGLEEFADDTFTDNALREERGLNTRDNHNPNNVWTYSPTAAREQLWATNSAGQAYVYSG